MGDRAKTLTTLWHGEFKTAEGLCGLCGNSGIVDTTCHARDFDGHNVGGRYFCICPNGRDMKKDLGTDRP